MLLSFYNFYSSDCRQYYALKGAKSLLIFILLYKNYTNLFFTTYLITLFIKIELIKMKKQRFEDWEFSQINKEFGYVRHYEGFSILEDWLKAENDITKHELEELESLRKFLWHHAEIWNEDELKMFFIAPLLRLVNFQSPYYTMFTQRKFSAIIGEWQLNGIFDFVISKGEQHPEQPFFFLHEYKQERKKENDPLGQLLATMIVAQQRNEQPNVLYGCYVIGRNYFFVILKNKEYAVSDALLATNPQHLTQIFKMMRFVKYKIEDFVKNE